MNKLISVVVPIYNMEKYLEKCINSIINQTYTNLEILLIDDGSTDKSKLIIDKFAREDSRIKAYHKKNGGLSDARNYGIKKATGEYIGFVDSDDYIEKDMYEKLYNNLIKYKADISVGSFNIIYENDNIKKIEYKSVFDKTSVLDSEEAIKLLFSKNDFGNFAWNKLYKKKLFNNIKYPVNRKMEDLGTTYKLIDCSTRVVYTPLKLYNYYQRNGSIMRSRDIKFMNDLFILSYERFIFYDNKYGYLKDNYLNMTVTLLYSYIYLIDKDKYDGLIKKLNIFKIGYGLNYKEIIKYFILKMNKNLFLKLFTKADKNILSN